MEFLSHFIFLCLIFLNFKLSSRVDELFCSHQQIVDRVQFLHILMLNCFLGFVLVVLAILMTLKQGFTMVLICISPGTNHVELLCAYGLCVFHEEFPLKLLKRSSLVRNKIGLLLSYENSFSFSVTVG